MMVEVLTGPMLDELGSATVLDTSTSRQRCEKLKQLGGPPVEVAPRDQPPGRLSVCGISLARIFHTPIGSGLTSIR
jgi:hypothetical protein